MNPAFRPRKNVFLAIAALALAASLSYAAFQFSNQTMDKIREVSVSGIKSNAETETFDLSNSLSNKLSDITSTLQIIANTPAVKEFNLTRGSAILNQGQKSSQGLVDFYMWLDRDGRIVWLSNINQTTYLQYKGFDLSYRQYFIKPKETLNSYYSSVLDSNDRVPRLYISYPVLNGTNNEFGGIIAAGIRTDVLGKFLDSQLSPGLKGQVVVLDNSGIILNADNARFVGKNVFGIIFQSYLSSMSPGTLDTMNSGITNALRGQSGSADVIVDASGNTGRFLYRPILLEGGQFGALYMIAPYAIASDVTSLIDEERIFFVAMVVVIGASASAVVAVILTWNSRLVRTVNQRTADLERANRFLHSANEQLKIHEKLQEEFVNVAAHELRTPIQPLLAAAELMESHLLDRDELTITRREVDMVLRNAKRLQRLSSDILEVSRLQSGALKLKRETFSLALIIAEAINDAKLQLVFNADRLKITYQADEIFVYADKETIVEVISNLLTNAIKFTKEGTISIVTRRDRENNVARITITDSGRGIDPEVLPRLFGKFVTKSDKGTGIGLYISKKIIEAHGGEISGQNNVSGPGASFTFTVPLSDEMPDATGRTLLRDKEPSV